MHSYFHFLCVLGQLFFLGYVDAGPAFKNRQVSFIEEISSDSITLSPSVTPLLPRKFMINSTSWSSNSSYSNSSSTSSSFNYTRPSQTPIYTNTSSSTSFTVKTNSSSTFQLTRTGGFSSLLNTNSSAPLITVTTSMSLLSSASFTNPTASSRSSTHIIPSSLPVSSSSRNLTGSVTTNIASWSNSTVTRSSPSSTSISGTGHITTSFPTRTTSPSSSESSLGSITFIGSWSDTSIQSSVSFPWFIVPTGTNSNSPAEETSDAVLLGALFFSLKANRKGLTDPKLKSQYLKDIRKTRDETIALFNSLDVKPPETPDCTNTKRKRNKLSERQLRALLRDRSIISSVGNFIKGAIDDVGKLIGCAVNVVKNLVDAVEKGTLDLVEIEDLTDTLAEIGKHLEDKKDDPEPTSKENESSCTTTRTVTDCQVFCTLTSTLPAHRRAEATTQICSTTCSPRTASCTATAVTTTVTAESTPGPVWRWNCASDNPLCASNELKPPPGDLPTCDDCLIGDDGISYLEPGSEQPRSSDEKAKRSLLHPSDYEVGEISNLSTRALLNPKQFKNNVWAFLYHQLHSSKFVPHGTHKDGIIGSAPSVLSQELGRRRVNLGVTNLYGCTSVIVTSRRGVWMSHFWENPSFVARGENNIRYFDQTIFQNDVLNTLDAGCEFNEGINGVGEGLKCHAVPDGWFSEKFRPQVVIVTPRRIPHIIYQIIRKGDLEYPDQIEQIIEKLEEIFPNGRKPEVVDYFVRGPDPLLNNPAGIQSSVDRNGVPFSAASPYSFRWPQGKILFQYDPLQNVYQPPSNCAPVQWAAAEVWVEDRQMPSLRKDWIALEGFQDLPLPPRASNRPGKRDDSGSCPVSFFGTTSALSSHSTARILTSSKSGSALPTTSPGQTTSTSSNSSVSSSRATDSGSSTSRSNGSSSASFHGQTTSILNTTGSAFKTSSQSNSALPTLSKTCYTSSLVNCRYVFHEVIPPAPCPTETEILPASCTQKLPQATTTQAPPVVPVPPPYQPGICRVHIYYWTSNGDKGLFETILSVFDGKNNQLYSHEFDGYSWGDTIQIGYADTKLPYNVQVEWGDSIPKSRKARSPDRPQPAITSPKFMVYPVTIHVGDSLTWGFKDKDQNKMPYCNVGNWETSHGISSGPLNRQADCFWTC